MRWRDRRRSSNVEDRRGRGARVGGGLSIGGIIIGLVLWLFFDVNPMTAMQTGQSITQGNASSQQGQPVTDNGRDAQFVSVVLADTEDVWNNLFAKNDKRYQKPKLVLYTSGTRSACGSAKSAMGPFYCPADQTIYLDMQFFADMRRQLGISGDQGSADAENRGKAGDFAQAYVIAHEVGHHVQTLLGISQQVAQARQQLPTAQANEWLVRQELQADCFAGLWANHNQQRVNFLEAGDIEEALHAASKIGDDALAHAHGQVAVPDNFTHGTSEQRVYWFKRGLQTGDINQCNTFQ